MNIADNIKSIVKVSYVGDMAEAWHEGKEGGAREDSSVSKNEWKWHSSARNRHKL